MKHVSGCLGSFDWSGCSGQLWCQYHCKQRNDLGKSHDWYYIGSNDYRSLLDRSVMFDCSLSCRKQKIYYIKNVRSTH
jgi:hypothetical protein